MKKILFTLILAGSLQSFATGDHSHGHGHGHDHDAPGMVQAPKGGMIKSLENVQVEVVPKGKDIQVYLYSKDLKPVEASAFKVKMTAELPRGKKNEELVFKTAGNKLETSFDAKGAHRYTLIVNIVDPKEGHDDKLTFTIEPRK